MKRWLATLWYVLTLRCEEAERIRTAPDPAMTTHAQRLGERLHRALCSSCREARRRMQKLDKSLHDLAAIERGEEPAPAKAPDLDAAARARILDRLAKEEDASN